MDDVSIIHVPPTPNYDPYSLQPDTTLTDFQPVHVLLPEGTVLYYFPSKWINHHNPKKRDRLIKQGAHLSWGADYMCKQTTFNPTSFMLIVNLIAKSAIRIIYMNMLRLMDEVAKRELISNPDLEGTGLAVDMEGREIPEDRKAAELLAHNILINRMEEKLEPEMVSRVIEADEPYWFVWRHIYFFITLAIERNHGPIERMGLKRFITLWDYYLRTKLAQPMPKKYGIVLDRPPLREVDVALDQAATLFASILACDFLEENNPASWSLDRIVEFIGYVLVPKDDLREPISVKKNLASRLTKQLLNMCQYEPELSWGKENGSFSFQLTFKVEDTSRVDLAEFAEYAKGNKDLRGGKHNVKVADLSEDTRRALGKRYVELLDELKQVKKEAQILAAFNTAWQGQIAKKYPVLKHHTDLTDGLDLLGEVDTWQVCIEIAARETIPGYQQWEKKPTPNTLRTAAILPGQAA